MKKLLSLTNDELTAIIQSARLVTPNPPGNPIVTNAQHPRKVFGRRPFTTGYHTFVAAGGGVILLGVGAPTSFDVSTSKFYYGYVDVVFAYNNPGDIVNTGIYANVGPDGSFTQTLDFQVSEASANPGFIQIFQTEFPVPRLFQELGAFNAGASQIELSFNFHGLEIDWE